MFGPEMASTRIPPQIGIKKTVHPRTLTWLTYSFFGWQYSQYYFYIVIVLLQSKKMTNKSHNDTRASVSVVCLKPGCKKVLTETPELMVRNLVYQVYSKDSLTLPCGICVSCRPILSKVPAGDESRSLPRRIIIPAMSMLHLSNWKKLLDSTKK
jgi:hypothetical protein